MYLCDFEVDFEVIVCVSNVHMHTCVVIMNSNYNLKEELGEPGLFAFDCVHASLRLSYVHDITCIKFAHTYR